jgi:hypothetical protein
MPNEHKLLKDQEQGYVAEDNLRSLGDAFKVLRGAYVTAWENTDPRDSIGREKLWIATTLLSKVEGQMRSYVTNGKLATKALEEIRRAGEPNKKFLGIL